MRPGRFGPVVDPLGKTLKNAGAGGPQDRKHCIPEYPRPAFQGPPVFPTFQQPDAKAGVATEKSAAEQSRVVRQAHHEEN